MEGHRHDSVGAQERFLHSISMMDVDVHIQHTLMVLEQLKNGQDYVIHITETGRLHTVMDSSMSFTEQEPEVCLQVWQHYVVNRTGTRCLRTHIYDWKMPELGCVCVHKQTAHNSPPQKLSEQHMCTLQQMACRCRSL